MSTAEPGDGSEADYPAWFRPPSPPPADVVPPSSTVPSTDADGDAAVEAADLRPDRDGVAPSRSEELVASAPAGAEPTESSSGAFLVEADTEAQPAPGSPSVPSAPSAADAGGTHVGSGPADFAPADFAPADFAPADFAPADLGPADFGPAGSGSKSVVPDPAGSGPAVPDPAGSGPAVPDPAGSGPAGPAREPVEVPEPPVTGDDNVDVALSELADVMTMSLEDQLAGYEQAHRVLQDRLADVEG